MSTKIHNREAVRPRGRTWEQIEVTGEHPAIDTAGNRVVQVIDDRAVTAMAQDVAELAADPEWGGILIDKDHLSHDPAHSTEAMGWLMNAEVRDGQLWGLVEWSDLGAGAVTNRRLQYFSTEYDAEDLEILGEGRVRPLRLSGLALTNRPNNKGGRRITNRSKTEHYNRTQETKNPMQSIAEKLGLPAEATEDEILAALTALQEKAAKADDMENEAAAEDILNRHAKRIPAGQRDAWKKELLLNRASAERMILTLPEAAEETTTRPAITNRATAKTPDASVANGGGEDADAQRAAVLRIQNREKCSFVRAWDLAKLENPTLFHG
jgi:phage I-like protein